MATKLFLKSTTAAKDQGGAAPGDVFVNDMLTTTNVGTGTNIFATATASGTEIQWADSNTRSWVSPRFASGITLTTGDVGLWASENLMTANCGGRTRIYKLSNSNVLTELGGGPFDDGVEFGTTIASMTWVCNFTDTVFVEDDRLVIRFFITNIGTMGAGSCQMNYDGTNANSADSFLNINETITFKAEPSPEMSSGSCAVVCNAHRGEVVDFGKERMLRGWRRAQLGLWLRAA